MDGPNGRIDRAARRIVLGDHLAPAARCETLAHELGHWHDLGPDAAVRGEAARAGAEIVAEAVAFVVGHAAGLDTSDYSAGYALTWADRSVEVLRAAAERIDRAAAPILAGLDDERQAPRDGWRSGHGGVLGEAMIVLEVAGVILALVWIVSAFIARRH